MHDRGRLPEQKVTVLEQGHHSVEILFCKRLAVEVLRVKFDRLKFERNIQVIGRGQNLSAAGGTLGDMEFHFLFLVFFTGFIFAR